MTSVVLHGQWTPERLAMIPQYKERALELTRAGMYTSEIAMELGITTSKLREWRQSDPDFNEMMEDAECCLTDSLEREAVRRARDGVEELIVHQGQVVRDPRDPTGTKFLTRRTHSDSLLQFLLKGRRREVYGDKSENVNTHVLNLDGARERLAEKLDRLADSRRATGAPERSE